MEAVSTTETSVSFYPITRRIPQDSNLHSRRRENLKSYSKYRPFSNTNMAAVQFL
jgi:hypothetical protein